MSEQYGPTPTGQGIRGYRNLAPEEVGLVNDNKALEIDVAEHWASVSVLPGVDRRWAAVARTHFQEGFSALTRAITKPEDPYQLAADRPKEVGA